MAPCSRTNRMCICSSVLYFSPGARPKRQGGARMLIDFFLGLKQAGLPVSVKEYLMLCEALQAGIAYGSVDEFYYLSRACMVKDETNFDRLDRAFAAHFKSVEALDAALAAISPREIPEDWLAKLAERILIPEEKRQVEAMGA